MKAILSVVSLIMLFAVASGISAVASTAYGYTWHVPTMAQCQPFRRDNSPAVR